MNRLERWLWDRLREQNLSARDASIKAGLGHGAISRYLSGKRPSAETCRKLAAFFGVPTEYVLYLAGRIEAPPDHDTFLKQVAQISSNWTEEQRRRALRLLQAVD